VLVIREENYIPAPYDDHEQFWALADRIFFVIFLLMLAGVIFVLYLFFRYFNRRRKAKQSKDNDDADETIALTRNILDDFWDLLPRFGKYSKNAVRRAYVKKVNWHIRRGVDVKRSDTTDIIADKIRSTEDIDELTALYEKVRYFK